MSFTITAKQLELLKHAVDSYCTECGIHDREERLYIADLATSLLELGAISLHDLQREDGGKAS